MINLIEINQKVENELNRMIIEKEINQETINLGSMKGELMNFPK